MFSTNESKRGNAGRWGQRPRSSASAGFSKGAARASRPFRGVASLTATSLLAVGVALPMLTLATPAAEAAVTVGSNISVFPNRDMVVAVGYEPGEQLLVEVLRNDVVIGTTQGPAVETPEGVGLEVNHGPLGTPQAGDCWNNFTPDIIGGDVIRVTAVDREGQPSDTMTVQGVAFSGDPVLEDDGSVSVSGTATPGTDFAVEFRRDKPEPRFRRGPFVPVFEAGTNNWKATFKPTATSAEGLSAAEQREIALNEASWAAVADKITETTLAELGEPGGVGPGCNGSADPNTMVAGLDPINIASGDVVFSGTARAGVAAVSVTVGALGAREATVTLDPNGGPSTWTLTVPKADLSTLPDGGVAVTPRFDALVGATRTVTKDTVAPAAPTPSVAPGTYSTTQSVALNKPTGEGTSKVYWEIGNAEVPDPDVHSNLYTGQISVTSTQTIKGRLVDAAGNSGAVGSFAYKIGNPPPAPTNFTATESTSAPETATLRWTASSGATGYNVYRNDVKVNATPLTATSYTDKAGLGDHSYVVRAVEANGIESLDSNRVALTIDAPSVPTGLRATEGDTQVTLNWTAVTGASNYRIYRDGAVVAASVAGTSYINRGLTNGTLYEYSIASLDAGGNESARTGLVQAVPQVPADRTPPPAPSVNPATGTYTSTQTVIASNTEAGATQRYTISAGTTAPADPTAADPEVPAGGVPVSASSVVKVASFDAAGNRSTVVSRTYTIDTADRTAPPASSVSPASGTYTSAQTVTATNTEAGVTFRYTVGAGTTVPANPTTASPELPAAGLSVSSSSVVKVAAFDAAGNSSVETRTYTINTPAPGTRQVAVPAEADTMVKQASSGTAFGTSTPLMADGQELSTTGSAVHSYLRFNVTGLAAGETVTGAKLQLKTILNQGGTPNGPIVRRAANATSATAAEGLTWTASNPTANTSNVGNFGTVANDAVASTAVTGVTGNGVVTLQLAPESTDGLLFLDRTAAAADRPQLVLTVSGSGGGTAPDTTAPPAPSVNPASGTYTATQTVTATNTEAGVTHRYTVATGTTAPADPTVTSPALPAGGLAVSASSVVKVASFDAADNRSPVVIRNYTINTGTGGTRTLVVDAAADTTVRQTASTTNLGGAAVLNTDSEGTTGNTASRETSYVRFTIPALGTGESISAANLKLNVTNASANGPAVWKTATTWSETTMTYGSGQPARSGTAAVGNFGNMPLGSASTPLTGITAAGTVSFQLYAESTDGLDVSSRETTNRPQLVLTIRTP